jgi:hypothetical protein
MKRFLTVCMIFMAALFLAGCGRMFSRTAERPQVPASSASSVAVSAPPTRETVVPRSPSSIHAASSPEPVRPPTHHSRPGPVAAPMLLSIMPISGPPGTLVTFRGVGFGTKPGRTAFLSNVTSPGPVNVAIRVWPPTRIEAVVPKTIARGL